MPAARSNRSLARPDSLQAYSVRDTRAGISVAGLMWEPNSRSRRRARAESALPDTSHSRRHSAKPLSKAAGAIGHRVWSCRRAPAPRSRGMLYFLRQVGANAPTIMGRYSDGLLQGWD